MHPSPGLLSSAKECLLVFWPSPPSFQPFSSDGFLLACHPPCTVSCYVFGEAPFTLRLGMQSEQAGGPVVSVSWGGIGQRDHENLCLVAEEKVASTARLAHPPP
eukprot:1150865-Pelagomonas_calceolata.AAC.1